MSSPKKWSSFRWVVFSALFFVASAIALPGRCADFRVENKTFSENQKEPTGASTTIFNEGMVYDFMQDPEETIVYDKAGAKFVILDMRRKMKTELKTKDIAEFSKKLESDINQKIKKSAKEEPDALLKFMVDPKFEESFDATGRKLTLSSPTMTYQVTAGPADDKADVAKQYGEFSAWLVQLNAMLSPGGRLPFPRVELCWALTRRELVPREVTLITKTGDSSKKQSTARSTHQLTTALSASDLGRVKAAQQAEASFKSVSFEEYGKK
jgi:hypothetical protein